MIRLRSPVLIWLWKTELLIRFSNSRGAKPTSLFFSVQPVIIINWENCVKVRPQVLIRPRLPPPSFSPRKTMLPVKLSLHILTFGIMLTMVDTVSSLGEFQGLVNLQTITKIPKY